jgi:hypothetical protein
VKHQIKYNWLPIGFFALLSWLIMAPLWRPGFIFALDMVPTPVWRLPADITSSYPFYASLHLLNIIVPGDILQKLLLSAIFLVTGLGAHSLARAVERSLQKPSASYGAYVSGLLYVVNPYVYSRFMAGQYTVLLGYALLPWFARSLLRLLQQPRWQQAIRTGLWITAIGIVSLHSLGLVGLLAAGGVVAALWHARYSRGERAKPAQSTLPGTAQRQPPTLRKLTVCSLVAVAVFAIASSFWLLPLALGRGSTAAAIHGFGAGDQQAFATVGSGAFGRLAHVGRLEGFWAEDTGLYRVPDELGAVWWLALVVFLTLVAAGGLRYWRYGSRAGVVTLGAATLAAALLAAGIGINWLSQHIPLFAGYREPHKFTGLVALAYALCAGSGVVAAISWIPRRAKQFTPALVAILLPLPYLFTPPMLLGASGQLAVAPYPGGWAHVNAVLDRDTASYQVLFLPWHLYMHFNFAETIVANPAANFFDKPTLISNNPEFGGSSPSSHNPAVNVLSKNILPADTRRTDLGAKLAHLQIKYVILANEADADTYSYLAYQTDLRTIYHDDTITLYQNTAWQDRSRSGL